MLKKILLISTLSCALLALTQAQYKRNKNQAFQQHKNNFKIYKASQDEEFNSYIKSQNKIYNNYKKSLFAFWKQAKLSTKETLVTYSKDKKTRTIIDFKNNKLTIQTISDSKIKAKQKLKVELAKAVLIDTKTLQTIDPLAQKLDATKKPIGLITAQPKSEPILSTVIFNSKPTKKSLYNYVNNRVNKKNITVKKSSKLSFKNVYTLNVTLPKDTMLKRSKIYYKDVKRESLKHNIPISLIFAIIHSESSFNPRARSYVPAFGLMQIVPKTAGIDAYFHLYHQKKLVTGSYLYNSTNNIRMGTAYLHILYYKYLKYIENPKSRLYCTIAAYNTGAGNVAWAFVKSHNLKNAAKKINKLSSSEVYRKLLKDLKYEEPKHYLQKVSKRMDSYQKVYGI